MWYFLDPGEVAEAGQHPIRPLYVVRVLLRGGGWFFMCEATTNLAREGTEISTRLFIVDHGYEPLLTFQTKKSSVQNFSGRRRFLKIRPKANYL